VARLAERLAALGVDEIDVADTIGAATPQTTTLMLAAVRSALGDRWWTREKLTLHLHDTYGNAAGCVVAALDAGVRSFDAAAGGLGGCPYASTPGKPAPGNLATELLVSTVESAGYATGVDKPKLAAAGVFARSLRGPGTMP
jgi:hydroxymethylglutaryl-CoA lyase